jgi:hypothetical protein
MTEPIILPQVDPNYWLGGPASHPCRFSVVFRKGYYEIWDLHCPSAQRFDRIADRVEALRKVSLWAKAPVLLSEVVEPPLNLPRTPPECWSERRWGVKGEASGRKYRPPRAPRARSGTDKTA